MLVVAFNFRESESDKKTPGGKEVFGFNCKLDSSVRIHLGGSRNDGACHPRDTLGQ